VETTGAQLCADAGLVTDLVRAVDEAATNIVMHGDCEGTAIIAIEMTREGDNLVVRLTDQARLYDPTTAPPPDLAIPPWEREGGLGVHLIRQLTDQIIYRAAPGGGNELTLVKICPANKPARREGAITS